MATQDDSVKIIQVFETILYMCHSAFSALDSIVFRCRVQSDSGDLTTAGSVIDKIHTALTSIRHQPLIVRCLPLVYLTAEIYRFTAYLTRTYRMLQSSMAINCLKSCQEHLLDALASLHLIQDLITYRDLTYFQQFEQEGASKLA